MTNRIDGGPKTPSWEPTEATETTEAAGATEAATDVAQAQAAEDALLEVSDAASVEPLRDICAEIATQYGSGAIGDLDAAVQQVITRFIEVRFEHLEPELRAGMSESVHEALVADPYFVLDVEEMLTQVLDEIMEM